MYIVCACILSLIRISPSSFSLLLLPPPSPSFFSLLSYRYLFQIKDYDAISRIDQWLTTQLLHIKKTIAQTSIN